MCPNGPGCPDRIRQTGEGPHPPCFSSDCQPSDGGLWTESSGYFSFPSPLLETLRGRHLHGPPLQPGAGVPQPPQEHRTCIQLTFEKETEDGKLPFLDVCLCRESDGSVTTSVYRKPTHTNQYLPSDSHHPVAHKASVVRT